VFGGVGIVVAVLEIGRTPIIVGSVVPNWEPARLVIAAGWVFQLGAGAPALALGVIRGVAGGTPP
jgi:hypothetical protein